MRQICSKLFFLCFRLNLALSLHLKCDSNATTMDITLQERNEKTNLATCT